MSNKKASKWYVVWKGKQAGIYTSWEEAKKQVIGVEGAKYKSFPSEIAARQAFHIGPDIYLQPKERVEGICLPIARGIPAPVQNALAVDAACSGNPGRMEYRGVYVATGTQLFHFEAELGTNNIGEFLAIVHALAYCKKEKMPDMIIYSDSVQAQKWVAAKVCRTKLLLSPKTASLFEVIRRAEAWLSNNTFRNPILKWDTANWGEIPADFGRK
ncbi:MAG: ribonuclease H family protein [Bacteroidales bacterium]|nr:ribonuclease H family protein [Bacteroidales bacterium]